jgi:hypothetical protein
MKMDVKRRDMCLASIIAAIITLVSVGFFYLMIYRAIYVGAYTRPLQFVSLPGFPGIVAGAIVAGALTGNFQTSSDHAGIVLGVAIPVDFLLYFILALALLKTTRKLQRSTFHEKAGLNH